MEPVVVAAVQAAPVFLDREATVERACELVAEAAGAGARLILLPEAFVPGYPDWVWRLPAWRDGQWYERLHDQAGDIPGPATERLGEAARAAEAWVAVGVNERRPSGTLHNTLLYLAPDGTVAGVHRKLVATGGERTVWGPGDGSTLPVVESEFGRVGGLICWENYMPLARAALYQRGIDILLAPTWDSSDAWTATVRHIAKEGRVFVVTTNTCLRGSQVPRSLPGADGLVADGVELPPGQRQLGPVDLGVEDPRLAHERAGEKLAVRSDDGGVARRQPVLVAAPAPTSSA